MSFLRYRVQFNKTFNPVDESLRRWQPILENTFISEIPNALENIKRQMSEKCRSRSGAEPMDQEGGNRVKNGGREPIQCSKMMEDIHSERTK